MSDLDALVPNPSREFREYQFLLGDKCTDLTLLRFDNGCISLGLHVTVVGTDGFHAATFPLSAELARKIAAALKHAVATLSIWRGWCVCDDGSRLDVAWDAGVTTVAIRDCTAAHINHSHASARLGERDALMFAGALHAMADDADAGV